MDCASELKINLLETVISGFYSYFGHNEESGREPQHSLELDKSSDSSPCSAIFLGKMQKVPALWTQEFTHIAMCSFCLLLLDLVMPASSLPSATIHTLHMLLWLRSVTPNVLSGIPCRLSHSVVDSLPRRSSHSCVSHERTKLLGACKAEENQHKSQS